MAARTSNGACRRWQLTGPGWPAAGVAGTPALRSGLRGVPLPRRAASLNGRLTGVLPPERRAGLYRNGEQAGCAHVGLRVRPDCRTTHRQSFQRRADYESPSYRALPFALVDRADQEIAIPVWPVRIHRDNVSIAARYGSFPEYAVMVNAFKINMSFPRYERNMS